MSVWPPPSGPGLYLFTLRIAATTAYPKTPSSEWGKIYRLRIAVMRATIDVCRGLGYGVLTEGVELDDPKETRRAVLRLCPGYGTARPMPGAALRDPFARRAGARRGRSRAVMIPAALTESCSQKRNARGS